jgi:hypothetical protein
MDIAKLQEHIKTFHHYHQFERVRHFSDIEVFILLIAIWISGFAVGGAWF